MSADFDTEGKMSTVAVAITASICFYQKLVEKIENDEPVELAEMVRAGEQAQHAIRKLQEIYEQFVDAIQTMDKSLEPFVKRSLERAPAAGTA
jgi:hypothetical protein